MADPRGAVVQDLAGGLSLVVSPKVQYCAWCCLACSSVGKHWRKGRHLLSSSAGSTKLGGEADSPRSWAALQRDLHRLERWQRTVPSSAKGNAGPAPGEE